jgi:hypothetical protein
VELDKALSCKKTKNLPAAGKAYRRPFANGIAATCGQKSQRRNQAENCQLVLDVEAEVVVAAAGDGDQG